MNNVRSFKVAATLAAYRVVALTAANVVGYPTGAQLPIGITMDTVKDTTSAIPVALVGSVARLEFGQTVAAGALVGFLSTGSGTTFSAAATTTSLTLANAHIGILIGETAVSGAIADVLVMPGPQFVIP